MPRRAIAATLSADSCRLLSPRRVTNVVTLAAATMLALPLMLPLMPLLFRYFYFLLLFRRFFFRFFSPPLILRRHDAAISLPRRLRYATPDADVIFAASHAFDYHSRYAAASLCFFDFRHFAMAAGLMPIFFDTMFRCLLFRLI